MARDELLDDEDKILRGNGEEVLEAEKKLKHKLLPRNAWRLIPFFELFMSCPKDELRQCHELFLTYSWYKLCITMAYTVTRYLGLFGDDIVPTILYRYTQVLRRLDLLSSKASPSSPRLASRQCVHGWQTVSLLWWPTRP